MKTYLIKAASMGNGYIHVGKLYLPKEMIGKRVKIVPFEVDDSMKEYHYTALYGDSERRIGAAGEISARNPVEAEELIAEALLKMGLKDYNIVISKKKIAPP